MKVFETTPFIKETVESFGILNSACIESNDFFYFTGQTAVDFKSKNLFEGSFFEHANNVISNYESILRDIGLSLDNVIKVTCFLGDVGDYPVWNEVFMNRFNRPYPCRTSVGSNLIVGRLEVDIIAGRESRIVAERGAESLSRILPATHRSLI